MGGKLLSDGHSYLRRCSTGETGCGPRNMTVSPVYAEQRVLLTWEDHPSCLLTPVQTVYRVDVLTTDDMKTIHRVRRFRSR